MLYYNRLYRFASFAITILFKQSCNVEALKRNEEIPIGSNMKKYERKESVDETLCQDYLPNELWKCIARTQWIEAEFYLSSDPNQARTNGYIHGRSRGTQVIHDAVCNSTSVVIVDSGEYPLSTSIRMYAPESLVLALLDDNEEAARISDVYGLTPLYLALLHGYSKKVLHALNDASKDSEDDDYDNYDA